MTVKFRDLYDSIRNTEVGFTRMGVDIDNAKCGLPKCVLTNAQEDLLESYMDLANTDVDFCDLDFSAIIKKITECFDCVLDEFKTLVPDELPTPIETANDCFEWESDVIPLDHIKRFRIYERTFTHDSIPSPVQVYMVEKANLPYSFTPSVPEQYTSHEKYTVSWNALRESLVIKVDHDLFPEGMGAPSGSYNITQVVAEYTDEVANDIYQGYDVAACTAMLMTPGVTWATDHGLATMVDGDIDTYSMSTGTPQEIVVEFQFKAG